MQRAARLLEAGYPLSEAADIAAKQGKGHIAELQQSATYTTTAGSNLRPHSARPNPRANDPVVDVQVRRRTSIRAGAQVKVGSPGYVRRAAQKSRAKKLIVNEEAFEVLDGLLPAHASTRLIHRHAEAQPVSAADCHRSAAEAIVAELSGYPAALDDLLRCAAAGAKSGLQTMAFSLLEDLVGALARAERFDAHRAVKRALSQGARATARGTLQSYFLVHRFAARAGAEFSDRLLQRVARSTIAAGALAEFLIEAAIDLHAVLTNRMTFEELVRRFGVHATTAAGGAAGVALGVHLTRGEHPLFQLGVALLGGFLGSAAGRKLGEALFMLPAETPTSLVGLAPPASD
jgi:hypothetical protein